MALSGRVETNKYAERYYRLDWTATQDIEKNQSTISWTLSAESYGWWAERTLKVTIAGEEVFSKTERVERWDGVIKTGSLVVDHDAVGYKEFDVKIEAAVYYSSVNLTGSGTFVLDTIPRKATVVTAPNFTDEDNPTITYSNPAGNAVTVLAAAIYNADASHSYIPYKFDLEKTGTSYTFNLTEAEREVLRRAAQNSNTLDVRFYVHTQIGGKTFTDYLPRTLSIVDTDPEITAFVEDENDDTIALTGDNKILVKYHSNAKATMLADAQKCATIKDDTFAIANGVKMVEGAIHTFENVESNEFVFSVEDSRGNISTATLKPQMVDYIKLTCNIANYRPDALGNINIICNGNYFNGNFGAVGNTLTVQYRYATSGGSFSKWTDMNVTITGNSYVANADLEIPDFNQQLFYKFQTRAIDKLETVPSKESTVKSIPMFHWGENDFVFEVPVTFNAGASGVEVPMPDSGEGAWTPTLNSSAVNAYTTQYGWYSKIGQVVTVGFYVKATCKSGYNSTPVTISGLPFAPALPSAGGGMCSGAYVAANQNFQCYVAETDRTITARTQACNNTSATNLTTSASGCFYRSSGGEITLSGTITFITI